ncbi:hypothetical protein DRI50_08685 [candidate division KSB1 bacterium]|nr:MAG: hypothetical protein DRI50_08685 [candidate division KSB1 bacterium]
MSLPDPKNIPHLPLASFPALNTSDLDELRSVISTNYHPMMMDVPRNRRDFLVHYNHLFLDGISISAHKNTSHFQVKSGPIETSYILQFMTLSGAAGVTYKNKQALITAYSGAIVSPFRNCVNDHYEGNSQIAVRIEREELESCFEMLTGKEIPQGVEFDLAMNLKNPKLAGIRDFVQFIIRQLDQGNSFIEPSMIQTHLKDAILLGLLTAQPHNLTYLLQMQRYDSGPIYVRRVEEYIHANPTEQITAPQLARKVGVSLRSLQLGFQKHRGYTLSSFIKNERLSLARKNLLQPLGRNVTEIAFQCGFNHLSQFSADYKKKFGELPHTTLFRAAGNNAR